MKNITLQIFTSAIFFFASSTFALEGVIKDSFIQVGDTNYEVKISSPESKRTEHLKTIIFESGFGTGLDTWQPLIESLSPEYRTITYSRIGTGKTKSADIKLTISEHVQQLHLLIEALKIDTPITLVGHSYGGIVATEFARNYPASTNALVLIDPSVISQRTIFKSIASKRIQQDDLMLKKYMPTHLVGDYEVLLKQMDSQPNVVTPLPANIPTALLTSTKVSNEPFVFEETKQGKLAWLNIHIDLFKSVTQGVHYRVNNAGHNIHVEKPELVINAITSLIN